MPRYVILHHLTPPGAARPPHWDFMLEADDVLRTWALETEPQGHTPIAALALPDHRRNYLDFEGELSAGRGAVARWDLGDYELLCEEQSDEGRARLSIRAAGHRLSGRIEMTQIDDSNWSWRYWAD